LYDDEKRIQRVFELFKYSYSMYEVHSIHTRIFWRASFVILIITNRLNYVYRTQTYIMYCMSFVKYERTTKSVIFENSLRRQTLFDGLRKRACDETVHRAENISKT